jgi:hypothetical protein
VVKLFVAGYWNVDGPYITLLCTGLGTTPSDASENGFRELYRSSDDLRGVQCCLESCEHHCVLNVIWHIFKGLQQPAL